MSKFNLRVYALLINEKQEILLSDENRFGKFFTKFPGGGVEHGEGIQDALFRELQEELQLEISSADFFYFNEFHQASAFDQSNLVAFYYILNIQKAAVQLQEEGYTIPFEQEQELQRWKAIQELQKDELTFPIDQKVLEKLKAFLIK
ncbi:MAG: NUDIX domain-containing protein [Crocinitomicaceae bacterium]